jgi:hypothetical protein
MTWKEKETQKIEENHEKARRSFRRDLEVQNKRLKDQTALVKGRVAAMQGLVEEYEDGLLLKHLETLLNYLTGEFTHFVVGSHKPEIKTFEEVFLSGDDRDGRALKLLSLFGDAAGNLTWRTNQYQDGSGRTTTTYPFTSEQDAIEKLDEIIGELGDRFTDYEIDLKSKYGLSNPTTQRIADYYQKQIDYEDHCLESMESKKQSTLQKRAALAEKLSELPEVGES